MVIAFGTLFLPANSVINVLAYFANQNKQYGYIFAIRDLDHFDKDTV